MAFAPDLTVYYPTGNLLEDWDYAGAKEFIESGGKIAISPPRHRKVRVYGNTAIHASYLTIKATPPDDASRTTTSRHTTVWVKGGDQWKEVHRHASLLTPPQPE